MGWLPDAVAEANERIDAAGRWRTVRTVGGGGTTTEVVTDGREVTQFASNDYLGLATHPAVAEAAADAARRVGTGSGASRLIVGGRPVHDELEAALAQRHVGLFGDGSAARLFPTGFAANLGVIGALVAAGGRDDVVVCSDELNHASIIDGTRLARAGVAVYPHADPAAVEALLAGRARPRAVVVTDLVFSMDGDVADAVALARTCAAHDAVLVLDVAHDVFGELDAVTADVVATGADVVVVGTLSKALGALGGWVAAPRPVIDLVTNTARSFIFTTAPSPPDTAAALAALRIAAGAEGDGLRARLRANVDRLVPGHGSPIVPVMLGGEDRALGVAAALLDRGLLVPAIRPPTVPEGTCRLRVALSAAHTTDEVDRLAEALADLGVDLPPAGGVAAAATGATPPAGTTATGPAATTAATPPATASPTTTGAAARGRDRRGAVGRLVVVAGTGTEVGKTWVARRVLERLRSDGVSVSARKPAQSFEPDDPTTDADQLATGSGEDTMEVCPSHRRYEVAMAPPMAADALGRPPFTIADLAAELCASWPDDPPTLTGMQAISIDPHPVGTSPAPGPTEPRGPATEEPDAWRVGGTARGHRVQVGLVELAGGVRSPHAHDGDGVDLVRALEPDLVLVVADAGLGTINAVRTTLDALAAGGVDAPVVVHLNRFDADVELHRLNLEHLAASLDHPVTTAVAELAGRVR